MQFIYLPQSNIVPNSYRCKVKRERSQLYRKESDSSILNHQTVTDSPRTVQQNTLAHQLNDPTIGYH